MIYLFNKNTISIWNLFSTCQVSLWDILVVNILVAVDKLPSWNIKQMFQK